MKQSQAQWEQQDKLTEEQMDFGDGTSYTVSLHKKWVAEENFEVSYFEALPVDFKINQIQFDIFHS